MKRLFTRLILSAMTYAILMHLYVTNPFFKTMTDNAYTQISRQVALWQPFAFSRGN